MKANKIVVISLVLLSPVAVILFLNSFGENEYELPVYYKDGNPIAECKQGEVQHTVDLAFVNQNRVELPALFHFSIQQNFSQDLLNVLSRYPKIEVYNLTLKKEDNDFNQIALDSADYSRVMNCEFIMGESKWIDLPIDNRLVLVDTERRIRGYFDVEDIDEIDRLDTELDIMVNY